MVDRKVTNVHEKALDGRQRSGGDVCDREGEKEAMRQ